MIVYILLSVFVHGCSEDLYIYDPEVLSLDNTINNYTYCSMYSIVIIKHYHCIVDIIHSGWQYSTLLGFILWSYSSSRIITIE